MQEEIPKSDNFVDKETILGLASQLSFTTDDGNGPKSSVLKQVEDIGVVTGTDNLPSCYIVNYEDSGFIIMPADNRLTPVLAHSETGKFAIAGELPPGVSEWLEETAAYVSYIRESDEEQTGNVADAWNPISVQRIIIGGGGNDEFEPDWGQCPQNELVGPLLTTAWHQRDGFNNLLQYGGCNTDKTNGRYPAGCVAIAVAQVMRYHEFPTTSYFWIFMLDRTGTDEASRLVSDIGTALGTEYSCEKSNAETSKVPEILKNRFGYSSAVYDHFNVDIVTANLKQRRPVILSGARKEYALGLPYRGDGHAWVCDGYKKNIQCEYDLNGRFNGNYTMSTWLYMNWGWNIDNTNYNGWYSWNSWDTNDGEYNFNYTKKMVYNIKP
ncbi:hypothetical protein GGR21_003299 [Dysgonomonas hofstadii]|uniref:Spi protease inhibitor domain-containing protein n=1 Tax=Dysgonomonas hofstadii TaxID=637886 RepID=A0A840CY84_9BACT|nr:C10 family peptidase [Dysgonomonas hofstadii]MBB4037382.1 hypothetical protein [Dysgonomonas hofstadii]